MKPNKIKDLTAFKSIEDGIYLISYGSIPFTEKPEGIFYAGSKIDPNTFIEEMNLQSLGASGILTFNNKSEFTFEEMGDKCLTLDHLYGHRWTYIGILFKNQHPKVEKTFLRDQNFAQSWNLIDENVYVMNGSITSFKYLTSCKDDKDFDLESRQAFAEIYDMISHLWK